MRTNSSTGNQPNVTMGRGSMVCPKGCTSVVTLDRVLRGSVCGPRVVELKKNSNALAFTGVNLVSDGMAYLQHFFPINQT